MFGDRHNLFYSDLVNEHLSPPANSLSIVLAASVSVPAPDRIDCRFDERLVLNALHFHESKSELSHVGPSFFLLNIAMHHSHFSRRDWDTRRSFPPPRGNGTSTRGPGAGDHRPVAVSKTSNVAGPRIPITVSIL